MSLRTRLLLSLISVAIFAVLFVAASSLYVLNSVSSKALTANAKNDLTSKLVNTSDAIDTYFQVITSQIKNKAQNEHWIAATENFIPAFSDYSQQRGSVNQNEIKRLSSYYTNDFDNLYQQRNDRPVDNVNALYEALSANTIALQHDFIASSKYEIGNKDGLVRLPNTTRYASVHADFHPLARRFLKDFGYYDIFIVEPDTGHIVYSVFKELDYATSLMTGPYAKTGIGTAFAKANASNEKGAVFFSQLAPYLPSYEAMAGFISTPIYKNDEKVAILIFQIPLDRVNAVLTRNMHWQQQGFGESGETYMVNQDKRLVTESRFFLEDPSGYAEVVGQTMPDVARAVQLANTTVGIQPADTASVNQALSGKNGFAKITDYRGVSVFSAYSTFDLGEYPYALLAEIDEAEALELASSIQTKLLWAICFVALIVLVIAILLAVFLTNKVTQPLNVVGEVCDNLASGTGDLTLQLKPSGIAEIDRLLASFNTFITQVHDIILTIKRDSESLANASEELTAITGETRANVKEQNVQTSRVSKSIDELRESIEGITLTVKINRDQSEEVNHKLSEHLGKTDVAAQKIKELVQLIRESRDTIIALRTEVSEVTGLLEVINAIAEQTNLLALNAAIEAARAGEAGRGFSVVADEVRNLANRSQESTGKISDIIEKMTNSSDKSVDEMESAVSAADQGIELVDTVTEALKNLAIALTENQQLAMVVANATENQTQTSSIV
ncbi:MAG: methyl-accepting chemotaxis protein, partial [Glaciecola sp.]